jgi:hypothetical protein
MSSGQASLQNLFDDTSFDSIAFTLVEGDGPPYYVDSTNRRVSNEEVQALADRRRMDAQMPEITAEEIEQMGYTNQGNDAERFQVVSDNELSSSESEDDPEQADKDEEMPGQGEEDGDQAPTTASRTQQQANPAPANTATPAARSPRTKRWSEMKEWKLIIAVAKGTCPCPDNIYDLVDFCMEYQNKTVLKKKYAGILARAVENGWYQKAAELQAARDDLRKSDRRLNKVEKELKSSNTKIARLESELKKAEQKAGKTSVLAVKKAITKAKGKQRAEPAPTFQLPLPPVPEKRATLEAPKSTQTYVAHSEALLDQACKIMRSTENEDWSERAVGWLTMAETRPELKFK